MPKELAGSAAAASERRGSICAECRGAYGRLKRDRFLTYIAIRVYEVYERLELANHLFSSYFHLTCRGRTRSMGDSASEENNERDCDFSSFARLVLWAQGRIFIFGLSG